MKNRFIPDQRLLSIHDLDITTLKEMGKRGIIFDLDNTLGEQGTEKVNEKIKKLLKKLLQNDFKIGILSNDKGFGRERLKDEFSGLPVVFNAKKPRRGGYRKIIARMKIKPEETVMIGDQIFTDIYGANRLGIYSILVPPVNSTTDPYFTKIKRLIRNLLFYLLKYHSPKL